MLSTTAFADCPKTTIISFLLDETGSMDAQRDETITSVNQYIKKLQTEYSDVKFTLTKFNSERIVTLYKNQDVCSVSNLSRETYVPNSTTPLYDAIMETIQTIEKQIACQKDTRILFVILTDGLENSSCKYTQTDVFNKIKEKNLWQFVYLGVHPDAWHQNVTLGILNSFSTSTVGTSTSIYQLNNMTDTFMQTK